MSLITPELKARFDAVVARYPKGQEQSAVIPLLHAMQELGGGHLTQEHQQAVADFLNLPMSKVHEVTTFYTMFSLKPRGRQHLSVCRTLPCALCGSEDVTKALSARLGVGPGEVTADGEFSYEEVECLAQCHLGPVLQVGDTVYGDLTPDSTRSLIDTLSKKGRP
ncbi:MAG TPA: NAD(P)H-dependent oxidoreductase subunit E [bacterium]|jgi:NADH-quinone oxidoreductase E subunit|nr:NAD(P)H-dependent oxidoreductase subunit E [bacterium]